MIAGGGVRVISSEAGSEVLGLRVWPGFLGRDQRISGQSQESELRPCDAFFSSFITFLEARDQGSGLRSADRVRTQGQGQGLGSGSDHRSAARVQV